mgnify:CR=1 FL=1
MPSKVNDFDFKAFKMAKVDLMWGRFHKKYQIGEFWNLKEPEKGDARQIGNFWADENEIWPQFIGTYKILGWFVFSWACEAVNKNFGTIDFIT